MRSCNIGDKLAQQQVKEGPAKEAWIKEQVKFEIDRLKAVLRDGLATDEEKSIAQSQIANYQEMAAITERPLPGWLPQMDLLADPDGNHYPMMVEHCVVADGGLVLRSRLVGSDLRALGIDSGRITGSRKLSRALPFWDAQRPGMHVDKLSFIKPFDKSAWKWLIFLVESESFQRSEFI